MQKIKNSCKISLALKKCGSGGGHLLQNSPILMLNFATSLCKKSGTHSKNLEMSKIGEGGHLIQKSPGTHAKKWVGGI